MVATTLIIGKNNTGLCNVCLTEGSVEPDDMLSI